MPSSEEKRPGTHHEPSFTQAIAGHLSSDGASGATGRGRDPLRDEEVTPVISQKKEAAVDDEKSRHSSELGDEDHHTDRDSVHDENDDPEAGVPARTQSRASSARSRPIVVVPRSERRGLFGRFGLLPEITIPYDYSNNTKWFITILVAFCGFAAPIGSAIFFRESPPSGFRGRYSTRYLARRLTWHSCSSGNGSGPRCFVDHNELDCRFVHAFDGHLPDLVVRLHLRLGHWLSLGAATH